MTIPDHVASAWLCMYYHQISQDDYDGWPISIPGAVLGAFKDRGWIEPPHDGGPVLRDGDEKQWHVSLSDAGRAKADLDAADWFCTPFEMKEQK